MLPDYERSATLAMQTLIDNNINTTPIDPLPILKKRKDVLVVSFTELSDLIDIDRTSLVAMFGANQDASTFYVNTQKIKYIVAYNQRLPFYMLQRGLARELGHIVLGHDGTRPDEVRSAEAYCFAHHLLCPRPLIRAIQETNIPLTIEVVGNMTGCYERCLSGMRKEPAVSVSLELNREVRDLFADHIENFLNFQRHFATGDETTLADFGKYMNKYED